MRDMQKNPMVFRCGNVEVNVVSDEAAMGRLTGAYIVETLKSRSQAGVPAALWLMAAPSAFPFYKYLIEEAGRDGELRDVLRNTHFFQFDDYPVGRQDPAFEVTFRRLLEKHLYEPLAGVCGPLGNLHPLELTGSDSDIDVANNYCDTVLNLKREGVYFIQLKGIGMDGHWGFHGAETSLDGEPGMISVPMNSQNIRQQMLDWPAFFRTEDDVPKNAYTFNVPMFLLADEVIDNVPQASKAYSVLGVYGTDAVINELPSSAIKKHPRSRAYLTQAAASALVELRSLRQADPQARLGSGTLAKLKAMWRDESNPETEANNIAIMENVLAKLGIV